MNSIQKWGMLVGILAVGMGIAKPAMAGSISASDIAIIVKACVAIDRGEVTADDLDVLDDEEYSALMNACGFVADGSVSESEMSSFTEYYTVFQSQITSFETVVEEHTTDAGDEGDQVDEADVGDEGDEADEADAGDEGDQVDEADAGDEGDQVDEADAGDEGDQVDEADAGDEGDQVDEADAGDEGNQADAGDQADEGE
jgi:hypothetical protein